MKLFNGKILAHVYSLAITPAAERQSSSHIAILTVADRNGDVVNMFERTYAAGCDRTLAPVAADNIRKDILNVARWAI